MVAYHYLLERYGSFVDDLMEVGLTRGMIEGKEDRGYRLPLLVSNLSLPKEGRGEGLPKAAANSPVDTPCPFMVKEKSALSGSFFMLFWRDA